MVKTRLSQPLAIHMSSFSIFPIFEEFNLGSPLQLFISMCLTSYHRSYLVLFCLNRFANGMAVNDPLQTLYQLMSGRQPIAVKECADQVSLFNDHPVNGQARVNAFNNYQLQEPNTPNPQSTTFLYPPKTWASTLGC